MGEEYFCDICGKIFSNRRELALHKVKELRGMLSEEVSYAGASPQVPSAGPGAKEAPVEVERARGGGRVEFLQEFMRGLDGGAGVSEEVKKPQATPTPVLKKRTERAAKEAFARGVVRPLRKKGKKGAKAAKGEDGFKRPDDAIVIEKSDVLSARRKLGKIRGELKKSVVGQEDVVNEVLLALLCDEHALLEGVPGLAKSLLIESVGRCIAGTKFQRIQFVPDLLPSDIVGVNAYNPKTGEFFINKGPIFADFVLADEINRAPPKTQAAMLSVMQERKVVIHTSTFKFPRPFLVLATQNPLEQSGTYPLPEALVDRFFMKILVDYPSFKDELEIIDRNTVISDTTEKIKEVATRSEIVRMQTVTKHIYIADSVKEYIVKLVHATRGSSEEKIAGIKYVRYGGSPRAAIFLGLGARANAILEGRDYVLPDDVITIAHPVLRHRMILNYEGKASNIKTDDVIREVIAKVEAP